MQDTIISDEQLELVKTDLAGKVRATGGYDAIIWKIRTGYVLLVYGAVGLFLGRQDTPDLQQIANSIDLSLGIFVTIVGFSFSVCLIDHAYVRQKMRVVVTRDELMQACLNTTTPPTLNRIRRLLTLAGEDPTLFDEHDGSDDKELRERLLKAFDLRMKWNRERVLAWLYLTAPILSVLLYIIVRLTHLTDR